MEVLPYWPNYAAEWSIYNASNAKRILKNSYINQIVYTFSVYYAEILIFCFTQWWYIYNLIYSKPIYCINVNSCHILVFKRNKLLSLQTNLYLHWRDPNVFCVKFLSKLKFNKDIIRSHTTSRPFRTFFFCINWFF